MKGSFLWPLFGIAVFFFAAVLYAIYRGRDFRALLKLPFAAFSFETKEPGSDTAVGKAQTQAPQRSDSVR